MTKTFTGHTISHGEAEGEALISKDPGLFNRTGRSAMSIKGALKPPEEFNHDLCDY